MEVMRKRKTLEIYRGVLKGNKWPTNYWKDELGKARARICIEYMVSKEYSIGHLEGLENRIKKSIFTKYKLNNMLSIVYGGDAKLAIIDGLKGSNEYFRNKFIEQNNISFTVNKRNELGDDTDKIKDLIKNTIINNTDKTNLLSRIISILSTYKLTEDFNNIYNSKLSNLVNDLFPNEYKVWEIAYAECTPIPVSYWDNKENRKEAYDWITSEEVSNKYRGVSFGQLGLENLLVYYRDKYTEVGSSTYSVLFPFYEEFDKGEFTPLDFNEDGYCEYWQSNKDVARMCTEWLIKELNLNETQIPALTYSDFSDNGLGVMLTSAYNGDIFLAINDIYPDKYLRWNFKENPFYIWSDKSNRISAINWMFKKEQINVSDLRRYDVKTIKELIDDSLFSKYNLDYLYKVPYKRNLSLLFDEVFPGVFNRDLLDELSIADYKKLFGEYKELKLCSNENGKISVDVEELSKIFRGNPNFWADNTPSFSNEIWTKNQSNTKLLEDLMKGNLKVYKYSIDEVDEPKDKRENSKAQFLARHSKAKYPNTAWLYWRAYKFFERVDLYLDCSDIVMGLSIKDYVGYYGRDFFEPKQTEDVPLPYTKIRCGELELDRLDYLLSRGIQYVWVFPFDYYTSPFEDEEDNTDGKVNIYLIESIYDFKEKHLQEVAMRYKSIEKHLSKLSLDR